MKFFVSLMCALVISTISVSLYAQNNQRSVVIGQMTSKPNAILVLNPDDDDQGFLVPQLTTNSRLSITPSSPSEDGLIVFDITEKEFYYWKNNEWVKGLGSNQISDFVLKVDNKTIRLNDDEELELKLNSVTTQNLVDKSVTSQKLNDNSVTNSKLADGSVTSEKLANTSVTPGTYGNSANIAQFTVDAQGRITAANNIALSGTIAPTVQYYSLDPADFSGLRPASKKDRSNALIFEDNTTFITAFRRDEGTSLVAPLHLPDGATIQGITLHYMDKDPGNISMSVYRKQFPGVNDPIMATWNSTGNSPTIQSTVNVPIAAKSVIDNSVYSYRIVIALDPSTDANDSNGATHRIYGIQIKYLR